uniref:Uncharacterized protein n=1 Tax=Zea mays TaxID=4577 RepID=A0A804P6R1_MAIZE
MFFVPLHVIPAGGGSTVWENDAPPLRQYGRTVAPVVAWPHLQSQAHRLIDDDEVHRGYRDGFILVVFFGDKSTGGSSPASSSPSRTASPRRQPTPRPSTSDVIFFLVNLPAFDTNVDYHRHQTQAARQRFVRRRSSTKCLTLPWLMAQRDAAEKAAHTVPGMEMTTLFSAYRRAVFSPIDHLRPSVGTSGWIPSFRLLRTREPRRQSELNKNHFGANSVVTRFALDSRTKLLMRPPSGV